MRSKGLEPLVLGSDGGWLRDGQPWAVAESFYAVLGDPIANSLSPVMQQAALRERGLQHEYLSARIPAGALGKLKDASWPVGLAGFNVTAPLKEEAARLCDSLTPAAREIGVVNTVRVAGKQWLGHNTDSGGILAVLSEAWPATDPPVRTVVLGAGGSARAAVSALARWGAGDIEVRNRSAAGRQRFRAWLEREWLGAGSVPVAVSVLERTTGPLPSAETHLWVSCLPQGVDLAPYLPETAAESACLLLDLRYGQQLPLQRLPLGLPVVTGETVLLLQGGLSFAWWFGPPVPWQEMRQALVL